jgi:2'-5' RNA ligase
MVRVVPRVFVGLPLPDGLREQLALAAGGVPAARWVPPQSMHLTLHFIGELEGPPLATVIEALGDLRARRFSLELRGVGTFPHRGRPRVLWAGVGGDRAALIELHAEIGRVLLRAGVETERRKFAPHVTLARFAAAPDERRLRQWVAGHAMLSTPSFDVDRAVLFSSIRHPAGARYTIEAAGRLRSEETK